MSPAVEKQGVLGVDLGTSHTVAVLRWPDGRTRPLLFDGQPLLPSAVYRDRTGRLHVGRDALRLGQAEPDRLEPHPKRHVDAESVLLGGDSVPVVDLLAALLGAVAREAVAAVGFLPPAVLTYPAGWGARRRDVLVAAVAKAGWPRSTRLVAEPNAAARYFSDVLRRPVPVGSALAVFDFGAGTVDVAVVRDEGLSSDGWPRFEVAASGGLDDLGGLDFDAALVEHLGRTLAGTEPAAWAALTEPVTLAQWRARRQFFQDIRGAKEMLSRSDSAPVAVPGVEHAVELTRAQLEAAIEPLIRRAVAEAAEVIAAAGLSTAELAGLFLVGGSTRVPMVARLLHGELGIAPIVLDQPELPVAEGAIVAVTAEAGADAPEQPIETTDMTVTAPHVAAAETLTAPHLVQPATLAPAPEHSAPGPGGWRDWPVAPSSPAPHYTTAVDPWAEGEAAAAPAYPAVVPAARQGGESWLASEQPSPGPARTGLWAYPRRLWILIGLVAVVGLAATLVVVLWPGYRAIDYQPLTDPVRIPAATTVSSAFADAEVRGDRAYFASADSDGRLGVVAADTGTGKRVWSSTEPGVARRWASMVALPDAVVILSDTDSLTSQRRMIVLGANDGRIRWQRSLADRDQVFFVGDVAVLVDLAGHRLVGLKIDDGGRTAWTLPDLKTDSGTATTIIPVTTPADLAGPATVDGRAFAPDPGDDTRIVQLSGDRSARVIDAADGKVLVKPRQSVAAPTDEVVAHNGRLIVHENTSGADRIVSYDLGKLGEPKVLYTAEDTNRQVSALTGCGDDRVCFIERDGYDAKLAHVVSVDAKSGARWSKPVPNADQLVPVGESLLVGRTTSPDGVTLMDKSGRTEWTRTGQAARLNAGNLLIFSDALQITPVDPALSGEHLGDKVVPLGSLRDIRTASCSWDTANLACVAESDFVMQKFAG